MTKQGSQGEVEVLFDLIRSGDISKVIEFLRKSKDLYKTALDSKKRTPLHVAAEIGSSQLVDLFLNKGLSVFARDKLLRTPLHWAALNGHEVALELLVKAGSEIYSKDSVSSNKTSLEELLFIMLLALDQTRQVWAPWS